MTERPTFKNLTYPAAGERITFRDGKPVTPDNPVIPFIEGDGIGRDIWKAAVRVFDASVATAYNGKRKIEWLEVLAGEKSFQSLGEWLPDDTLEAIRHFGVAIKGPLTTPVGGGIRSINVALRQLLDLYSCVRPVKYYPHAPSPVKEPQKVDFVIFRENSEDTYCGIEFASGTPAAERLIKFLNEELIPNEPSMKNKQIRIDAGVGIKPSSKFAAQRLMRRAMDHAIEHGLPSVTIVHKGNIMKFTEGSFKEWCYELALTEYRDQIVTEDELYRESDGKKLDTVRIQKNKIIIRDRIADAMLQQVLLRPDSYSVLVTMNLNGDYLSDACAAQVGGLGIAPGANIGDNGAVFEATHGTAPKYADKNVINPSAVILSGVMMLEWMGWREAARKIESALVSTLEQGKMTYDFARQAKDPTELGTAEFADALIENITRNG
jgi:isocitrate dehydrogenase